MESSFAVIGRTCLAIVLALGSQTFGFEPCEITPVTAGSPQAVVDFGEAADISGDYAIVGAAGVGPGAAFVYERQGLQWVQVGQLVPDGVTLLDGDDYGSAVAIDGVAAVVGARKHQVGLQQEQGMVFMFRRDPSGTWSFEQALTVPDGVAGDEFGHAVDISGDWIVIGAPRDDENGPDSDSGSAYMFRFDGTEWTFVRRLAPEEATASDRFGDAVAIDGNWIAVGSKWDDDACPADPVCNSGSVTMFFEDPATELLEWARKDKLTAQISDGTDVGTRSDFFGSAVAIQGDRVVVGAYNHQVAASGAGAAFVYRLEGLDWVIEQRLTASDAASSDNLARFGLAILDDLIIACARRGDADNPPVTDSGTAYFFRRSGTTWTQVAELAASDAIEDARFGISAAIGGDYAIVGAPKTPNGEGTAYIFAVGIERDCNANLVHDDCEILSGSSIDDNGNGILDECECAFDDDCLPAFACVVGTCHLPSGLCEFNVLAGSCLIEGLCVPDGSIHAESACQECSHALNPAAWSNRDEGAPCGSQSSSTCDQPDSCDGSGLCLSNPEPEGLFCESDGNECTVNQCDGAGACPATPVENGAPCLDDGVFCTGVEFCQDGVCTPSGDPCTKPGHVCDAAAELREACSCTEDFVCDDGIFCSGAESCGLDGVCQAGTNPCQAFEVCDEDGDVCACVSDEACDEDGIFCNGEEICVDGLCASSGDPCAAPGLVCDAASEIRRACSCASDSVCGDGLFCNGVETCGANGECLPGSAPCEAFEVCDDFNDICACVLDEDCTEDGLFCNGEEICVDGLCVSSGDPCALPTANCDEESDVCICLADNDCANVLFCDGDETCMDGICVSSGNPCARPTPVCVESTASCRCGEDGDCDNRFYCDGAETCGADGTCQAGTDPCGPLLLCNETIDACLCDRDDECVDEGIFCNGREICLSGACASSGNPCSPLALICDEALGGCVCSNDTDCDDGDSCTGTGVCLETGLCFYILVEDCNANGIEDACDLDSAMGLSTDCNVNDLPDECELDVLHNCCTPGHGAGCNSPAIALCVCAVDVFCCESDWDRVCVDEVESLGCGACVLESDCNDNGELDGCEQGAGFTETSPALSPIDSSHPQQYTFVSPPAAAGAVTLSFIASADLAASSEFINVNIDGAPVGHIFASGANDCAFTPNTASITVDALVFNAALGAGDVVIELIPSSSVDSGVCPDSFIEVTIDYFGLKVDCNGNDMLDECDIANGTSLDCQLNGVPDDCESDCNTNGIPDDCDIRDGASDDCNDNGVPDACDLLEGTSSDCQTNGIPDECDVAEIQLLVNGGFEAGDFTGWTRVNNGSGGIAIDDGTLDPQGPGEALPPCSGSFSAVTFQGGAGRHTLYQDVTIPASGNAVELSWTHRIRNHALDFADPDQEFRVEVWDTSNVGLEEVFSTAPGDPLLGDCTEHAIDLSDYLGETIRIAFTEQDALGFFNVYVDSIRIAVTTGGTSADCNGNRFPDECEPDCNLNEIADSCDIANGTSEDCTGNGVPDECEDDCNDNGVADSCDIANGVDQDCNGNLVPDECDIASGASDDCEPDGVPDDCQADCNANGVADVCDIAVGDSSDCTGNGIPDECDIVDMTSTDCNDNATPDECDIRDNASLDCQPNGTPDECEADCNDNDVPDDCDIRDESSLDCQSNGIPDECEEDCNTNQVPDDCDVTSGTSTDCNDNVIPDECEPDCNQNGAADSCDLTSGAAQDCNVNLIPDTCDVAGGASPDCDGNLVPDECQPDCNTNGVADICDIASGNSADCNGNGVPDECDLSGHSSTDCNENAIPDECDISAGTSLDCQSNVIPDECEADCDHNGIPDECELTSGTAFDCNFNGLPDVCDIANGPSLDCQPDGVPDECEVGFEFRRSSEAFSPVDASIPQIHRFVQPPSATGDVTFSFRASADLAASFEFITISLNGAFMGRVFQSGASLCAAPPDSDSIVISAATFNDVVGGQDAVVNMAPATFVNATQCPSSYIQVTVFYELDGTEDDCNDTGVPDECDVADGTSADCNGNGRPDECETSFGMDCNENGIPDECDLDCNANGIPDDCDIDAGTSTDCNVNDVPDECDLADGTSRDCNENARVDECDIESGTSTDCQGNDIPDECETQEGDGDCNGNSVPDECDIAGAASADCQANGVPDECEVGFLFISASDVLSPMDASQSQMFTVTSPPSADGDVELTIVASGDLSRTSEYVDVSLNGIEWGSAFGSGADDCSMPPDSDRLVMSATAYNAAVNGGDAVIEMTPSPGVQAGICAETSIAATLQYRTAATGLDCNENDVPDDCESLGLDFDISGTVDLSDFLFFADCLAGPNEAPQPPGASCVSACLLGFDADGDGDVDVKDASAFYRGFTP